MGAETKQAYDAAVRNNFEIILQALMHRFNLHGDDTLLFDPRVIALECAAYVAATVANVDAVYDAVDKCLPPNATPFERGLALGVAMMVATERQVA